MDYESQLVCTHHPLYLQACSNVSTEGWIIHYSMLLAGCQVLKYRPAIKQGRASDKYHCSPNFHSTSQTSHIDPFSNSHVSDISNTSNSWPKLLLIPVPNNVMSQQHAQRTQHTTCTSLAVSLETVPKSYRHRLYLVRQNYFWFLVRYPPPSPESPHPPPPSPPLSASTCLKT